jgi:hypothetical protein
VNDPLIPLLIAAVGGVWTIYSFAATARINAIKPFLEKQLEFCVEVTQAAAEIATSENQKKYADAVARFWELYWGRLALVEDEHLESAMVKFGEALKKHSLGADQAELKAGSLRIAQAARNLVITSWKTGLNPLRNPERRLRGG